MSNAPAVSIIIPTYNLAAYIVETIDSALAQTYRDFEIIVINDGSTDDTEERITPFRERIVYIKQKNGGVMAARNAGLRAARGRAALCVRLLVQCVWRGQQRYQGRKQPAAAANCLRRVQGAG